MKKTINILLILFTLSSCASINKKDDELLLLVNKINNNKILIDNLDECNDFPLFNGETFADLYSFLINDVSKEYYLCKNLNHKNIEYIKNITK